MMDLEALRAQARAVASRMDTRISAALDGNRELTAEEQAENDKDEAELADLKAQIATAEAAGPGDEKPADPHAAAVASERERIMGLADLCPSSVLATPLRTAIEGGVTPGAFAIDIARASKARGASVEDLKAGAVKSDQLPQGNKRQPEPGKAKTGAEQAKGILALAANAGHRAVAHLIPKG